MSRGTRELTTVLAIAGRGLTRVELAQLVAGRMESARVSAWLAEAADHAVVDLGQEGRYWFHHPLQAEVLEARAHPEDRRGWHEVCAKLLESREGRPRQAARVVAIADHYYAAGLAQEAFDWSLEVAIGCEGDVSAADVVRGLERALELCSSVDHLTENRTDLLWRLRRTTARAGDLNGELRAVEGLLDELQADEHPEVVAELWIRRMNLRMGCGLSWYRLEEIERAEALARRRPDSWQYALAVAELSDVRSWYGKDDALELAQRAVALAERVGDDTALAYALAARTMACVMTGELTVAMRFGSDARHVGLRSGDWWGYVHCAQWELNALTDVALRRERLADCRREMQEHGSPSAYVSIMAMREADEAVRAGDVRLSRELIRYALGSKPNPMAVVWTRLVAERLALLTGALDEAEQHQARVEELFGELAFYRNLEADTLRPMYLQAVGRTQEAWERCRDLLRRGTDDQDVLATLVPMAARALADMAGEGFGTLRERELAEELAAFEREYPSAHQDGSGTSAVEALAVGMSEGEVTALEDWYAAELARARRATDGPALWERAAARLDEARLPWEAAYAWMRLGEAHLIGDPPDRRGAAAALRGAIQRATPLEARPVLEKVEALARSARIDVSVVPEPPQGGGLPGLTRREREILEHVVAGRTYGEIAEALVVSEKTVSSHISNMLHKTGTSNRHELAARAVATRPP